MAYWYESCHSSVQVPATFLRRRLPRKQHTPNHENRQRRGNGHTKRATASYRRLYWRLSPNKKKMFSFLSSIDNNTHQTMRIDSDEATGTRKERRRVTAGCTGGCPRTNNSCSHPYLRCTATQQNRWHTKREH